MKIKYTVKPKITKISNAFKDYPGILVRYMRDAMTDFAIRVQRESRKEAPVDDGRLYSSIGYSMGIGKSIKAVIQPNVDYAYWVHEGTDPYIIRPTNKQALYWEGAEHPVKKVKHPGIKANPFMERGLKEAEAGSDKIFNTYLEKATEKLTEKMK